MDSIGLAGGPAAEFVMNVGQHNIMVAYYNHDLDEKIYIKPPKDTATLRDTR